MKLPPRCGLGAAAAEPGVFTDPHNGRRLIHVWIAP